MFWASPLAGLCVLRHGACSVSKNSCGPYDCHDTHTFLSPSKHVFPLSCRLRWASLSVGGPGWRAVVFTQGVLSLTCPHSLFFSLFTLSCFHFYSLVPFLTLSLHFPLSYLSAPSHTPSLSSVVALPFLQIPASLLSKGLMFSFSAPSGNRDLCFGLSSNVTFSAFPAF